MTPDKGETTQALSDRPTSSRGVLCAKCEHLNPAHESQCEYCGAHLYILCPHCDHRNQRVLTRCTKCRQRLHRAWWRRIWKKLMGRRARMTRTQVVLLVVGVLLGFGLIVFLSELSFRPLH